MRSLIYYLLTRLETAPRHIIWRWVAVLIPLTFVLFVWCIYTLIGWLS